MRALSAEASRHHNQKEGSEVEKSEAGEADKRWREKRKRVSVKRSVRGLSE